MKFKEYLQEKLDKKEYFSGNVAVIIVNDKLGDTIITANGEMFKFKSKDKDELIFVKKVDPKIKKLIIKSVKNDNEQFEFMNKKFSTLEGGASIYKSGNKFKWEF